MPADAVNTPLPLILVRGFGGLGVEDEKKIAYQGFNDGTVYPQKRGENYIYEGLILRFMKSHWQYQDATNVVGYYARPSTSRTDDSRSETSAGSTRASSVGDKIVIDPAMALHLAGARARPAPHAVGLSLLRPERPQLRRPTAGRWCA